MSGVPKPPAPKKFLGVKIRKATIAESDVPLPEEAALTLAPSSAPVIPEDKETLPPPVLPVVSAPVTPASFASGHPSPSESKSKWFGIPSLSVSFEQVNLGLALDRVEDAKLNVAFATPPKLEVPATPYNLKYLYFLPA